MDVKRQEKGQQTYRERDKGEGSGDEDSDVTEERSFPVEPLSLVEKGWLGQKKSLWLMTGHKDLIEGTKEELDADGYKDATEIEKGKEKKDILQRELTNSPVPEIDIKFR